ncbi:hypothetical protein AMTR_s00001p00270760 [Amborella trichopoda]|uniref:1-aminocyclopropane-1-carboxylate synthase n=2 Tax=Amborella trichopoda TaxID=13333 RepID=W1NL81_AMBTC|nr:hypothetical protein AMTR_s00001p00270760 [Amborella trichopoda]
MCNPHLLSNVATNDAHGENSPYFDGWKAYDDNPYHPINKPHGVIQMGLAENQLCFDLIEDWMRRNPQASICTSQGLSNFKEIALYQDYHGLPSFTKAVAEFMEQIRGGRAKFDPNRIVMSGGATGANELIAFCLADPGEAFLLPTPYYPGFDRDVKWRTGVELIPVHCKYSNDFRLSIGDLEAAYNGAQERNIKVKGVLVASPSNPLGTVLDEATLIELLEFSTQKQVHLVCDEIYSATVFFSDKRFISVAEILQKYPGRFDQTLVHIVYSLSKDLGLPGFRVGIIYSYNDIVVKSGRRMSSFGLVSTQTQHLLACLLADKVFVAKFLEESRARLKARFTTLTKGLERVGIHCLKGGGGLFCWMNLRPLLQEATVEEELRIWRRIVHEVRLNVSPGSSFHCTEPGWFRVCFANMDEATMATALHRIKSFLPTMAPRRRRPEIGLVLSASRTMEEMKDQGKHMLDFHPLSSPHSPLLKATS